MQKKLSFPKPYYKPNVQQSWKFTFARQAKLSVFSKRILALVFAQIQEDDKKLRKYYQIPVQDVIQQSETKNKNAYRNLQKAVLELAATVFEFEDEKGTWYPLQLINTSGKIHTKIEKGVITIVLNPHLKPLLVGLSHYTKYHVKGLMKLNSWYAMRLYEILSAFKDTGFWEVSIEDFRQHMDLMPKGPKKKMKYKSTNLLVKRTIEGPKKELDPTDVAFDFAYKTDNSSRGRPKVTGFIFTLKQAIDWENAKERLALARKHPNTRHLMKRMEKDYRFKEKDIIRYMDMGRQKIGQLVYNIGLQKADGQIKSLPNYAFASFENELEKHKAQEAQAVEHIRELFS